MKRRKVTAGRYARDYGFMTKRQFIEATSREAFDVLPRAAVRKDGKRVFVTHAAYAEMAGLSGPQLRMQAAFMEARAEGREYSDATFWPSVWASLRRDLVQCRLRLEEQAIRTQLALNGHWNA